MSRRIRSSGFRTRLLAAVALVVLVPAAILAESLTLKNDTAAPVLVQGACVVRGVLVRDRPYLLNPGDKTPDIVLPGNKIITISEAKVPNRVLFQGVVQGANDDQSFSIQHDGQRVTLEKRKVKRSERP